MREGSSAVRGIFAGVPIRDVSLDQAAASILRGDWAGQAVHLCNAYTLSLCYRDATFGRTIRSGLALADGLPVAYWARGISLRPSTRPRGPALMRNTLAGSDSTALHYFYGGSPETLDRLVDAVGREFPRAAIVGAYSPPFRDLAGNELAENLATIARSRATVLWIGLGTPKQDTTAAVAAARLPGATCICVGAAFDFMAGTKREAPVLMRFLGLEWCFRLMVEPRRLWKRYLVDTPYFVCRAGIDAAVRRLPTVGSKRREAR